MPLATAGIQVGAAAIAADIDTVKMHSGSPGAAGTSNTTTAGSQTAAFTASGGVISLTGTVSFTGGAASGAATHVSMWAGATYLGSQAIETGDTTFNAAGEFDLTALTITGSATD